MTKKLKLAIVLLVTVASMNMNAQKKVPAKAAKSTTESKTTKPSKQETMDWVAGKMKESLTPERQFISYANGKFVYKKEWKSGIFCETTIDLNTVTGMNDEYSKDFYVSGKQITFVHCDGTKPGVGEYKEYLSISGPNYNDYSAPFNFTPDQALVDRLKKAFTNLIEYNSTKKGAGEAF